MPATLTGRVDLHLHSYASNVTDYYAANAFALPESYSNPRDLYQILKRKGMSLVTLTDHNSIDGVKELLDAGYKDVFISAEMTTTFPEDGCNIHITVINMTEAQFKEIDRLRGNVYEMVAYVDSEIAAEGRQPQVNKLAYFMTHPLMSTQNRPYGREGALSVAHLEKALLLCHCLEAQNGARTRALNDLTQQMFMALDRKLIEKLANRHRISPKGDTPWLKAWVAGSDDHSGINPGATWTTFDLRGQPATANALVETIRERRTGISGAHGGPLTIAHSVIKLLYEGGDRRVVATAASASGTKVDTSKGSPRSLALSGPLQSLLRMVFQGDSLSRLDRLHFALRRAALNLPWKPAPSAHDPFEAVLERCIHDLIADPTVADELARLTHPDDRIFFVIKSLVYRVFTTYLDGFRSESGRDLIGAIKQLVALMASNVMVSLPYLLAFTQQSADGLIARDVRKAFGLKEPRKLALLTDTFFEVNGVSATIKRMLRESIRRELDFTVITCVTPDQRALANADPELAGFMRQGRLKLFDSVSHVGMPQYDGLTLHFPPVLDILKYLQEEGFSKVQLSTPGTVGLTGLLASKLLQIESSATYHTSFPEYVENYTKDVSLEALTWKYMILFYHAVDEAVVPSQFVARLLHKRGLRKRKLLVLDRWVDVQRFRPDLRSERFWDAYGLHDGTDRIVFAYVGRLAVEKNLHLLCQAYAELLKEQPLAHLVFIGDGPYKAQLIKLTAKLPVTFTGYLGGESLARAVASIDVKVFPSCTDTWGNAPLEAQAAGVPVIVTDIGGPAELVRDGETGIVVRGNDMQSLLHAMRIMTDRATRERMGLAAREFAEAGHLEEPFAAILDAEAYRRRQKSIKHAAAEFEDEVEAGSLAANSQVASIFRARG
jgi:glycosyltransferase involved in cell wall biosynthesis